MVKYRIYTVCQDNGDGSASCLQFATFKQAETYVEAYNKNNDECINEENISYLDLEFDDQGVLQNPDIYEAWYRLPVDYLEGYEDLS